MILYSLHELETLTGTTRTRFVTGEPLPQVAQVSPMLTFPTNQGQSLDVLGTDHTVHGRGFLGLRADLLAIWFLSVTSHESGLIEGIERVDEFVHLLHVLIDVVIEGHDLEQLPGRVEVAPLAEVLDALVEDGCVDVLLADGDQFHRLDLLDVLVHLHREHRLH